MNSRQQRYWLSRPRNFVPGLRGELEKFASPKLKPLGKNTVLSTSTFYTHLYRIFWFPPQTSDNFRHELLGPRAKRNFFNTPLQSPKNETNPHWLNFLSKRAFFEYSRTCWRHHDVSMSYSRNTNFGKYDVSRIIVEFYGKAYENKKKSICSEHKFSKIPHLLLIRTLCIDRKQQWWSINILRCFKKLHLNQDDHYRRLHRRMFQSFLFPEASARRRKVGLTLNEEVAKIGL